MNPVTYAQLSQLAYMVAPEIGQADSSSRAIVRATEDGLTVVFRGSDNIESWITNLDAIAEEVPELGRVHSGFNAALDENLPALLKLNVDVVTGHSLGGALAILLAAKLCVARKPPKAVFAFEMPRVSVDGTIAALFAVCGVELYLTRNGNDIVPMVPEIPLEDWQHPAPLAMIGSPALPIDNVTDHEIGRVIAALEAA